ncbi:MAG: 3'(2'),5'-bisphosphate nucleotidase CysQ [Pseudorhodobacter sp.]
MPESEDPDLALLIEAVHSAGQVALGFWRRNPQSWEKEDGAGPVTEADLAVNATLARSLRRARPDYGWLSEETPDDSDRLKSERCFIVDPIDGTRAFIEGQDSFAVSVALARAGQVTAGAVFLPARDRLYTAQAESGAYCNGREIHASSRADMAGAEFLAAKSSFRPEFWPDGVPDLRRAFRPSLAYRLCLVAEGRFDGMMTLHPVWEWDVAAGSLIAERAGAVVSDGHGQPLRFNKTRDPRSPGIFATGPRLHAPLIKRRHNSTKKG